MINSIPDFRFLVVAIDGIISYYFFLVILMPSETKSSLPGVVVYRVEWHVVETVDRPWVAYLDGFELNLRIVKELYNKELPGQMNV